MRASVVIATYNYARFLSEAIRSVQEQTVSELEIIVVDDGSTDDTPQVLAAIDDPRLCIHRIPNGGVSVARNRGLEVARGDLVAFLDADDRWRPTKLERQLALMESEPELALTFTDFVRFDENGFLPHSHFSFVPDLADLPTRPSRAGGGRVLLGDALTGLLKLRQPPAWAGTVMVRRSALGGVAFPPGVEICEDLHFVLRAYARGPVGYLEEAMTEVRRHGANSFSSLAEVSVAAAGVFERMARETPDPEHRQALRRQAGRAWTGLGYHSFHTRHPAAAARAAVRALRYPGSRLQALKRLALLPAMPVLADPGNVDWRSKPRRAEPEPPEPPAPTRGPARRTGKRTPTVGFVVLSHKKPHQLRRLCDTLLRMFPGAPIVCHHDFSRCAIDPDDRPPGVQFVEPPVRTGWGDASLVEATVRGLEAIHARPDAPDWVFLLSGADYPIRPAAEILRALESSTVDAYVRHERIAPDSLTRDWLRMCDYRYRTLRVQLPVPGGRRRKKLEFRGPVAERLLPFSARFPCYAGSQWFTLNRRALGRLLAEYRRRWVLRAHYRAGAFAPDESHLQTLLANDRTLRVNNDNQRFIVFPEAEKHPQVLTREHLPAILASGALFARKFDADHHAEVLDALDEVVLPGSRRREKRLAAMG